jgi:hypothetical protein
VPDAILWHCRPAAGALATGRAKPSGAVKILARGAAKAVGLASATLTSNLVSVSARAAGMAKGSANLTAHAWLSARGAPRFRVASALPAPPH